MKNHIAFKFIAVVLCAASLLGAIGSGLGIFVMTESGLYDKTVEEVRQERLESTGIPFAQAVAVRYASVNLGGCPEQLVNSQNSYWYYNAFNDGFYGYRLMDAEGNVLDQYGIPKNSPDAVTYEFPISGEYMQIQSITPESEMYPQVEAEQTWLDEETYIYDAIPYDGAGVTHISFTCATGESEGMGSDEDIGFLSYTDTGYVQFEAFHPEMFGLTEDTISPVTHISFMDMDGVTLYEASSPEGVGCIVNEGGRVFFRSEILSAAIDPEVVPETWEPIETTEAVEETTEGIPGVIEKQLNIRLSPSLESSTAGYLEEGDKVRILQQETVDGVEWGYIRNGVNVGWIMMEYVALDSAAPAPAESVPDETEETISFPSMGVLESALNIYRSPDPNGEVAGRLDAGTTVEIILSETVNGLQWGQIDLGWILLDYVMLYSVETEPSADDGIPMASETIPEETVISTVPTAPDAPTVAESPTAPGAPEAPEISPPPETWDIATEPADLVEIVITDSNVRTYDYFDHKAQESMYVEYVYAQMPEYTVELTLAPGALRYDSYYNVLELVWEYRNDLFVILGASALLFAILAVYLCCAAGRKPGSDAVHAAGLNCIPLDAYLCGGILGISCLCIVLVEGGDYLLRQNILVGCVFTVGMAYLACLIFVGFCFAFAAQVKTPGGYWCTNTILFRCLSGVFGAGKWFIGFCADKIFPFSRKTFGWLCHATVAVLLFGKRVVIALYGVARKVWCWLWALVKKWAEKLWKALGRFLSLIPLTWQWLLVGVFMIMLILATDASIWAFVIDLFIVLYGTHCFGTLMESARRMSKGDLDTKVDDKLLIGCFKDFSGDLNDLADVAVVAAQKQLKSERMKTELITNVSHDIKTPLTSIINYVDLLQKPHTDKEQAQYLEVLDRQSQRLKKLIDDLMEMSKANTGNMTVDITRVDAAESINQALGEFSDKLTHAQLIPVFRRPEETVYMMADGRLVWRVLSNLLSNAVKYALPGTRLYIDLMELEGKVILSLKNISREELNVDADELMERFVRGDDSRNTEGSGLGLNIAKSLMELQKGQLQLLVDGDLFKVTLIFPGA